MDEIIPHSRLNNLLWDFRNLAYHLVTILASVILRVCNPNMITDHGFTDGSDDETEISDMASVNDIVNRYIVDAWV